SNGMGVTNLAPIGSTTSPMRSGAGVVAMPLIRTKPSSSANSFTWSTEYARSMSNPLKKYHLVFRLGRLSFAADSSRHDRGHVQVDAPRGLRLGRLSIPRVIRGDYCVRRAPVQDRVLGVSQLPVQQHFLEVLDGRGHAAVALPERHHLRQRDPF